MSAKTETTKPTPAITLFDAFGPNVSEEVKAINHRAAELSMDDMVKVMGLQDSASKTTSKVKFETKSSFALDTPEMLALLESFEEKHSAADLGSRLKKIGYGIAASRKQSENVQHVIFQMLNDPSIQRGPTITPTHSRRGLVVKRAVDSAADQLQKLLDEGVDSRSISIAIKYQDPETGLTRTRTVEDDSSGSAGARVVFRRRTHERKVRKTVRDYFADLHPAGSKK
ncbi:hypothetical protein [Enterobacter sp. C6]|uniref:hypothetical protein n=1 Tax=Enterobacter sp. C6 TaxID=1299469 RepID=UPI0011E6DDCD|nr:hypothetical protein [Enterobacter sp. C6]KAE8276395.1 hypothetical protein DOU50_02645 [Enterobacter sp. C6]